jgi:hypothetical protein
VLKDINTCYRAVDFPLYNLNHRFNVFLPNNPLVAIPQNVTYFMFHILCRYSPQQGMLQSPPGPLRPHQYLLLIYEK